MRIVLRNEHFSEKFVDKIEVRSQNFHGRKTLLKEPNSFRYRWFVEIFELLSTEAKV